MRRLLQITTAAATAALVLNGCGDGDSAASQAPDVEVATECAPVDGSKLVVPDTLTVSVSGTAPPLDTLSDAGEHTGMYVDLVHEWAAALDIEHVEFVPGPFSSMITGLMAGQWDMGGAAPSFTEERRNDGGFLLSEPYLASGTTLLVPEDGDIKTWADLEGKILGGATGEIQLDDAAEFGDPGDVQGYDGGEKARQALRSGLVDAVAGDALELQYYVASAPDGDQYTVLDEVIEPMLKGTLFGLEQQELRDGVSCVIEEQTADGRMAAYAEEWYGTSRGVDTLLELQ